MFLHRSSCHPKSCFTALLRGEDARLRRTCSYRADYKSQLEFFRSKLRLRGFSSLDCRAGDKAALPRRGVRHAALVRLKVKHSSSTNYAALTGICKRFSTRLRSIFKADVLLQLSKRLQSNLFVKHYRDNWKYS